MNPQKTSIHLSLSGIVLLGAVLLARAVGLLQELELRTFDFFLRWRPLEGQDERIVIVAIDKEDIQRFGKYPIPALDLVKLINQLQTYQPTAIGLDIFSRDILIPPEQQDELARALWQPNVILVERVLPPLIEPAVNFPVRQIGFSDVILDKDNHVRRMLLGTPPTVPDSADTYKFALSIRLAQAYLAPQQIHLETGIRDPGAMRFGSTELPRFLATSGGYQLSAAEAGGVQILLNFRSNPEPFRVLSAEAIETAQLDRHILRDRIVIVGITDPRYKNALLTSAIKGPAPEPGLIDGVEIQAHAVSQIVSAVLDGRALIRACPNWLEYFLVAGSGCLGILIGRQRVQSLRTMAINLISIVILGLGLGGVSYGFLAFWGWWLPVVPTLLVLGLNGMGLSFFSFYQHNQDLKSRVDEREHIIERTFDVIHNGPLQRLANVLRGVRDQDLPKPQLLTELEYLNLELRQISKDLEQDLLTQEESFRLGNGRSLDLRLPLHDLFYEVYSGTLERDFPGFTSLKVNVRTFMPVENASLSIEQKRGLCQFLEEALCNVGKHAIGATRLEASGERNQPRKGWYTLRIRDNGPGVRSSSEGEGTRQVLKLKAKLKGKFKREFCSPRGTLCELSWPLEKPRFWFF